MTVRKNKNRGYQQLRVWQYAMELYDLTCKFFSKFPYELRRVASNQIASVDSIHRNIAEGYCRRSINEYLLYLNYALGSLGESVSGVLVYGAAGQISEEDEESWNSLAYKLENGLIKLVEKLQRKRMHGDWDYNFLANEQDVIYETKKEN